jgi:hypothetical protein
MDNEINQQHLDLINEEFFIGNPISINEELQGQGIDDNSNYILGCKAGPTLHVSHLVHEMCHFAELETKRILSRPRSGWGFTYGTYWEIGSNFGYEPQTDQSVRREMRTWAYQWSLQQKFGIPNSFIQNGYDVNSIYDLVSSSIYLHAFSNYKYNVLSRDEIEKLGYPESNKKTIEILAKEVLELSKTFTFDRFRKEWKERMDLLKAS